VTGIGNWFTTSNDRAVGRVRLDPLYLRSPGSLAAQLPARFGIRAPMDTFGLSTREHEQWAESFHGGWCEADHRAQGLPFACVSVDVASCFPLVAHHLGWWDLLCAERIERRGATAALRRACRQVASDPAAALDPEVWRRFGCTLVEVIPDGEPFPVEIEDSHRPDGRLEVVALRSPQRPMHFPALDVLASAARSERVPHIIRATRYVPVGRRSDLRRRLAVLPGLVLEGEGDPAVQLAEHRREVKRRGDLVLGAELRLIVNALVYGNLCRFDETLVQRGGQWVVSEKPGPWNCLPIASSVTAGSRLLLAVLDRLVENLGSTVVYRDTDSSIIPASPDGGTLALADDTTIGSLAWSEVDEVLARFDSLAPAPWWPVWECQRGTPEAPLQSIVFGPKRHVEYTVDEAGTVHVEERTEAALGGFFADPPTLPGRAPDGGRWWTLAAIEREVTYALARRESVDAVRAEAPWDEGQRLAFPTLRRLAVTSPAVLDSLPASLGARPGTRYVEGIVDLLRRGTDPTPVALDPGGDLADWQTLTWVARSTGQSVTVTTDPMAVGSVLLESLGVRAAHWASPPRRPVIEQVSVHPALVRRVGRVSGVLDADLEGLDDLAAHRPVYDDGDPLAFLQAEAQRLGQRAFARRAQLPPTTAGRIAARQGTSVGTIARAVKALSGSEDWLGTCALDGCNELLQRPNARYCSKAHRDRASRARQAAASPGQMPASCSTCGAVLIGPAALSLCPVCSTPQTPIRRDVAP
jgi:hypothetical protein